MKKYYFMLDVILGSSLLVLITASGWLLKFLYNHVLYLVALLCIIITYIVVVAIFTLFERKLLASVQRRRGPNVVGLWGFLQAIADGLKLVVKEFVMPQAARFGFFVAPCFVMVIALSAWAVAPAGSDYSGLFINLNLDLLLFLAVSSLSVYGIITAGWSSGSRFAFLGAQRSVAQLVSYEIAFGLTLIPPIIYAQTFSFTGLVGFQAETVPFCLHFPGLFACNLVIMLAETNRTPFDLPEAEAELVAGFNVEYSATAFALFFLGEYGSMVAMAILVSTIFLGGWSSGVFFFVLKVMALLIFFVLIRGAVPRYRYDQLMAIFWKYYLFIIFGSIIWTAVVFIYFGGVHAQVWWDEQAYRLIQEVESGSGGIAACSVVFNENSGLLENSNQPLCSPYGNTKEYPAFQLFWWPNNIQKESNANANHN